MLAIALNKVSRVSDLIKRIDMTGCALWFKITCFGAFKCELECTKLLNAEVCHHQALQPLMPSDYVSEIFISKGKTPTIRKKNIPQMKQPPFYFFFFNVL